MPRLIFLGTASAIPDNEHENTHMILQAGDRTILIDCACNPVTHLPRAGIDMSQVTDLILTHFHPDHVAAAPTLLMSSWLMGRKSLLNIYGLDHTLDRLERLMDLYEWSTWPGFYPVMFHRIPETELSTIIDTDELRILASPVRHLIPGIGLRFEFPERQKIAAYSSDTEPCPAVISLAENADVLIHEATGEAPGHTSARKAGEIAARAGAKALYLIHYRMNNLEPEKLLQEAKETYQGPVSLAQDFVELQF